MLCLIIFLLYNYKNNIRMSLDKTYPNNNPIVKYDTTVVDNWIISDDNENLKYIKLTDPTKIYTITPTESITCEIFMVGGGGAGGFVKGNGGNGGSVVKFNYNLISGTTYTFKVGNGGKIFDDTTFDKGLRFIIKQGYFNNNTDIKSLYNYPTLRENESNNKLITDLTDISKATGDLLINDGWRNEGINNRYTCIWEGLISFKQDSTYIEYSSDDLCYIYIDTEPIDKRTDLSSFNSLNSIENGKFINRIIDSKYRIRIIHGDAWGPNLLNISMGTSATAKSPIYNTANSYAELWSYKKLSNIIQARNTTFNTTLKIANKGENGSDNINNSIKKGSTGSPPNGTTYYLDPTNIFYGFGGTGGIWNPIINNPVDNIYSSGTGASFYTYSKNPIPNSGSGGGGGSTFFSPSSNGADGIIIISYISYNYSSFLSNNDKILKNLYNNFLVEKTIIDRYNFINDMTTTTNEFNNIKKLSNSLTSLNYTEQQISIFNSKISLSNFNVAIESIYKLRYLYIQLYKVLTDTLYDNKKITKITITNEDTKYIPDTQVINIKNTAENANDGNYNISIKLYNKLPSDITKNSNLTDIISTELKNVLNMNLQNIKLQINFLKYYYQYIYLICLLNLYIRCYYLKKYNKTSDLNILLKNGSTNIYNNITINTTTDNILGLIKQLNTNITISINNLNILQKNDATTKDLQQIKINYDTSNNIIINKQQQINDNKFRLNSKINKYNSIKNITEKNKIISNIIYVILFILTILFVYLNFIHNLNNNIKIINTGIIIIFIFLIILFIYNYNLNNIENFVIPPGVSYVLTDMNTGVSNQPVTLSSTNNKIEIKNGNNTNNGKFKITFTGGQIIKAKILMIAGGGGGGCNHGGGGGAGEYKQLEQFIFKPNKDYFIQIGKGGKGGTWRGNTPSYNGEPTYITDYDKVNITVSGGGAGGGFFNNNWEGKNGGCGGGGAGWDENGSYNGIYNGGYGVGITENGGGNNGGKSRNNYYSIIISGGGGGGIGGVGGDASDAPKKGGDGGNGKIFKINGIDKFLGGGGGGGGWYNHPSPSTVGRGGSVGINRLGGNGSTLYLNDPDRKSLDADAEPNTGSGGGGGNNGWGSGGNGSSGIMYIYDFNTIVDTSAVTEDDSKNEEFSNLKDEINKFNLLMSSYLSSLFILLSSTDTKFIYDKTKEGIDEKIKDINTTLSRFDYKKEAMNTNYNITKYDLMYKNQFNLLLCYLLIIYMIAYLLYLLNPTSLKYILFISMILTILVLSNFYVKAIQPTHKETSKKYWQKPSNEILKKTNMK